jgi:hypothetical protein
VAHNIETITPEAISTEDLRADTVRLVGQAGILLADVDSAIKAGDELLESSRVDADKQLSDSKESKAALVKELAERKSEIVAKLKELLSAPEISKLSTALKSVQELSATGISDRSLIASFAKDEIVLDVVQEEPEKTFIPIRELEKGALPIGSVKGDVDGLSINKQKLYTVSLPGYELTAKVVDGDIASSEGPRNYEYNYKTPITLTEYTLQVGGEEGFVVSDRIKDGLTVDNMHGSRIKLSDTNARVVAAHLPGKQVQILGETQFKPWNSAYQ